MQVSLKKQGATKEVAKRAKGDVIGEMTFLLGDLPGVSVVAEGPCEAYVLKHSDLVEKLTQVGRRGVATEGSSSQGA